MKKYSIIALVVVIALVAVFWGRGKVNSPTISPEATNATPTVAPETTDSAPAGWQTYKNEDLGYEIQYPNGWYVYMPAGLTIKGFWPKKYEGEGSGVWIDKHLNPNNLSLRQWWDEYTKKYADYDDLKNNSVTSSVNINGVTGILVKTTANYGGRQSKHYLLPSGSSVYEINSNVLDNKLFDQIIFSFKLI